MMLNNFVTITSYLLVKIYKSQRTVCAVITQGYLHYLVCSHYHVSMYIIKLFVTLQLAQVIHT